MIPHVIYVVAMDLDGTIGKDNALPWHLAADLKYFKELTLGENILMGRKTYESIGRPLPGRNTIVLTRDHNWKGKNWNSSCSTVNSVLEACEHAGKGKLLVAGGAEIYLLMAPYVEKIHTTIVDTHISGDITFPDLGYTFKKYVNGVHQADEKNEFAMRFETWIPQRKYTYDNTRNITPQ